MSVGVLALQGSFHEHIAVLKKLGVDAVEVRKAEQLEGLCGLIIPGGESTTMAKLAERYNLFPALREHRTSGKPTWGTCAGLIFLANEAIGQKKGGQDLLGGLDCIVHRNFFGSQINSFEAELPVPKLAAAEGGPENFRAVFIRAPAILEAGPAVEVLAEYTIPRNKENEKIPQVEKVEKVIVAVKQGSLLATAFHPELTSDHRWHKYFLKMVKDHSILNGKAELENLGSNNRQQQSQAKDLPIFCQAECLSFKS